MRAPILYPIIVLAGLGMTLDTHADPPPWAPAHGYRAKDGGKSKHKNKRKHERRHSGDAYDHEVYRAHGDAIGIPEGACHREVVGGLVGGAVGGVLGSRIGKGDGQLAATAAGSVIGYIVGSAIGRSMDELDQACVGQALERAYDQRTVAWTDSDTRYELTPTRTFERSGRYCRDYEVRALVEGRPQQVTGTACRNPDGSWSRVP
jgi:surface antigen